MQIWSPMRKGRSQTQTGDRTARLARFWTPRQSRCCLRVIPESSKYNCHYAYYLASRCTTALHFAHRKLQWSRPVHAQPLQLLPLSQLPQSASWRSCLRCEFRSP